MSHHLVFLLLGLANGAVFASLALALVMFYRSSGVINFATGAIALVTAYAYAFLRRGLLLILIPGLPRTVKLGTDLGFAAAAAAALVMAAVLGLVMYLLVFRPLRTAPAVARAVASLGIMIVLTGVVLQRLGTSEVHVGAIFPTHTYKLGSILVSADRIWFAVTVVGVGLALGALYHYTSFGLRTRAAAESEEGAFVSGLSPDRIAAVNWMLGAVVAGLAGILIAPIVPLVPVAYTLFIVPALAAAIAGRFQSFTIAVVAGLGIGVIQSELTYLQAQHSWLPKSGLAELVPLALILIVLVVQGRPLPSRGALVTVTLGRAPRPRGVLWPGASAVALAALMLVVLQGTWRAALLNSLIFGIIALSLVVVTGYAGQVSLAQLTLAGTAGFLLSPLTASWGVPFPIAPIMAACGATVIGVAVGLPALRIRGLPVAVVTLALAVTLQALWFQNPDLVGGSGKKISGPTLLGLNLRVGTGAAYPRLAFCFMVLVVLAGAAVGVAKLRTGRLGSAMLAVRANERSAAAAGINVVRTKVAAFAIAAFIAGIGGSLLAYRLTNVTVDPFDAILGLSVFAIAYLAGITSVSGGLLAGVLATGGLVYLATNRWLSLSSDWYQVVMGVGLVLTVVFNPEGIVGPVHARLDGLRSRRGRAAPAAPVPAADVVDLPVPAATAQPGAPAAPVPVSDAVDLPVPAATARRAGNSALLSLHDVSVHYGGVEAVRDVSFDVGQGQIIGLIGPNGAGKTTLIDAITGFVPATGTMTLDGRHLAHLAPHRRSRAGLARTFQGVELWNDLTVAENVGAGLAAAAARADGDAEGELLKVFDLVGLRELQDRLAGELSHGQRQLVSIARALVGRPAVALLDEPAGGLDSTESLWLADRLRDIRDSGVTILLIDHDMRLVLNLCDRIEVLNFGTVVASGTPAAIRADPVVADAYLGGTPAAPIVHVP